MICRIQPALLLAAVIAVCAAAAPQARAEVGGNGVLPVCGTGSFASFVVNEGEVNGDNFSGSLEGALLPGGLFVGIGLVDDCAFQEAAASYEVCEPGGCSQEPEFAATVSGGAVPDTVDAAGGDEQVVNLSVSGTKLTGWAPCYPGDTDSQGFCPSSLWAGSPTFPEGIMIYRYAGANGDFSGPWDVSIGESTPGFQLRENHECAFTAVTCSYTVVFTRDPVGTLSVTKNVQLVLAIPGISPSGGGYQFIAVPMLVQQEGGAELPLLPPEEPTPTPTPNPNPNPNPSPTPGAGGGAAANGGPTVGKSVFCVVPKLAGVKLAAAESSLAKHDCRVGKVTKRTNRRVGKGKVISTSAKAGKQLAAHAKVNLLVSSGRAAAGRK